jgi:hypothetical protein
MIDELRRAFEAAEKQSEDIQHFIAEAIAQAIEDAGWDALFSTPESQAFLDELDKEADFANKTGYVYDLERVLGETRALDGVPAETEEEEESSTNRNGRE